MLKDFLEQYDRVGVINYVKDKDDTSILMQQTIYTFIKSVFNNQYIELSTDKGCVYTISKILLRNNPDSILVENKREHEQNITLLYHDDIQIDLIGYKA